MQLSLKRVWQHFAASKSLDVEDKKEPVETENQMSTKYIIILVLTSFFALTILCMLAVILYKWCATRRQKNDKNIITLKKPALSPRMKPRHMTLMRSDSSASEIDGSPRDSSLPPTPLSPLSEEDSLAFPFERGRLEFTVCFHCEQEVLIITIVQAHGLPQRSCVFYVEGTLLPDSFARQFTSIRHHNPSPVFEETLKFNLPLDELPERTLCLKVVELDEFSQKFIVGSLLYSFDMDNNKYMDITKLNMELSRSLPQDIVEGPDIGELLISLCYLPTSGRLTLVVLKCRLLNARNGIPTAVFWRDSALLCCKRTVLQC